MLNIQEDRFLRARDLKAYFSISHTTLDRWLKAGKIPQPNYVNQQRIWRQSAIEEAEASMFDAGGKNNA